MTPAERVRAADALPVYVDIEECGAMEGDEHTEARSPVVESLRSFFEAMGRVVYVSGEMAVYYPGQRRVVPDVFAVVGAAQDRRHSWVVSREGRGLDWVLEVTVLGDRSKDLKDRVVRYAELGIREYFVADIPRRRLWAWRLADPAVAIYTPIVPQLGRYHSEVLGLDFVLEGDRVRVYAGNARLLDREEMAEHLRDRLNDEQMQRRDAEEQAAAAQGQAAAAEERATAAEREVARLRELVEKLQRGG